MARHRCGAHCLVNDRQRVEVVDAPMQVNSSVAQQTTLTKWASQAKRVAQAPSPRLLVFSRQRERRCGDDPGRSARRRFGKEQAWQVYDSAHDSSFSSS